MSPNLPKNLRNQENSENTHPLKTINMKLKSKLSVLKKEQQDINEEKVKMQARVQQLLAKRNELLLQKKADDEERKRGRNK